MPTPFYRVNGLGIEPPPPPEKIGQRGPRKVNSLTICLGEPHAPFLGRVMQARGCNASEAIRVIMEAHPDFQK